MALLLDGPYEGAQKKAPAFFWELELIQPHMAQKPMPRGEVGARVRMIRVCG